MSAVPTPYSPSYDFSDFSDASPTVQQPGAQLDSQFDAIATLTTAMLSRAAEIQRDDGAIKNGVVTLEALSEEAKRNLAVPTLWATGTAYAVGNQVIEAGSLYYAAVAHTSGVFATDAGASKWLYLGEIPAVDGAGIISGTVPYAALSAAAITSLTALARTSQYAGSVVQSVYQQVVTPVSPTTVMNISVAPTITQGSEIVTAAITPYYSNSKIRIRAHLSGAYSLTAGSGLILVGAVFRNAVSSAIGGGIANFTNEGSGTNVGYPIVHFECEDAPATTSAITYRLRAGASTAITVQVGPDSSQTMGLKNCSDYLILEEIKQ